MSTTKKFDLIKYEYIVYIHSLETCSICKILLTKDDFVNSRSVNQVKWVPVMNVNVDIIDTAEVTGKDYGISIAKNKNRICGLFDAEPLDWKYAQIEVGNDSNTKNKIAIARMPRSPIVPVMFDISE
ncbi:Flp pilus assembly protein [Candidatus Scalindua japonica]|uniref:Flp pilus assembly protein n=1 Tax=Candidatus Scalindua japonica TaxID=1284222 RepID=A0A286TTU6_9BACT|nr:hypothetical protein [Candidatus Scalindua japonica]GAX59320.1 Flp pilus assembly protein [Candidatus Scalindua japonica]